MPRPRKDGDAILKRELRITPPKDEAIKWIINDTIHKFVAFEEGGKETGKKLHYHCYIETTMTSQALTKWIYTQADCIQSGERGNAVFFTRAPHDATMGYIAKGKVCVIRHNYDFGHIEKWFTQSDDYIKQGRKLAKRHQRSRQQELDEVYKIIEKDLNEENYNRSEQEIVSAYLKYCRHSEYKFPTRSQMESAVMSLLYKYTPRNVEMYYEKSYKYGF